MNSIIRIWAILSPAQRTSGIGLVGLMLVGMILEMVGLGIVVPALGLMASDTPVAVPPVVSRWLDWLGNPSRSELLLGGLVALLCLYVFKAVFILFSTWRQNRFVRGIALDLAKRLFGVYMTQPWTFHLQRHSAELIRNVGDVSQLANVVSSFLSMLAEGLVLVGILGLLLYMEPLGALAVGVLLAVAALLLERVSRRRLMRWGKEHQHHTGLFGRHLVHGLHAAKDIKVLGRERFFIDQVAHHAQQRAVVQLRLALFNQLPRLWYEVLAVAGLCVLTSVMVWQGRSTSAMIPTLGLFAAAAFRLLPSASKLSLGVQQLRYSTAIANTIGAELALATPAPVEDGAPCVRFRDRVELDGVSFTYPAAAGPSLHGVTLTIPYGSSVGLIGGSGAGKSTLVDVVLGLLEPQEGRILIDGVNLATNVGGWQRLVGYVPQVIYLTDDTIRANVAFGIPPQDIDDDAVSRALRSAQLDAFVRELPDGADTIIGEHGVRLSGGQRQRIGIARALYHDPELLVLDEATSALDNATEREVMTAIEALHGAKTLLIVAHRLTTVQHCDLIYQLDHGRLARCGSYAEVVLQ